MLNVFYIFSLYTHLTHDIIQLYLSIATSSYPTMSELYHESPGFDKSKPNRKLQLYFMYYEILDSRY